MIGPTPRRSIPAWLRPAPAVFMLAWGGNHFTPLLHLYEELGHYDTGEANLLLGMYVVGLIPGLLLASALSDKYGRKPILLIGIGFAILGSILLACGLDTFWLLCAGRTLAGVGVGVAMSVGTSWMKELSSVPFDLRAGRTAGARRPALTLTLGFGIGAAVTGALGQWGYAPTTTPYVLHVMLTLLALLAVLWTPESLAAEHRTTESWWRDLRVPAAGHRRFVRLVIPSAPWVFASAGIAYAVVPALVQDHLGRWTTLYATALAVLALGCGAVVQNFVPWINRRTGGNALVVGMGAMTFGMGLAVVLAFVPAPTLGLVVAAILGVAFGICVVSDLIHVQAIATPQDLAGVTGVYYSLAYAGFLLPTLVAALLPAVSYAVSLSVVSLICGLCLALVWRGSRS